LYSSSQNLYHTYLYQKKKISDSSVSNSSSASNVDIDDNDWEIYAWHKSFLHAKKKVLDENKFELDRYLETESEDVLNLDLLMWRKSTRSMYKILFLMVWDVLFISVTTVASKSAFCTSGHVLDAFRSSLTPRVVEGLICTQDWLRVVRIPINVEECIENAEKFEVGKSYIFISIL